MPAPPPPPRPPGSLPRHREPESPTCHPVAASVEMESQSPPLGTETLEGTVPRCGTVKRVFLAVGGVSGTRSQPVGSSPTCLGSYFPSPVSPDFVPIL